MTRLRLLLAALVGALAVLVLAPGPASACSCVASDTADFVERAEVVVVASVDDVQRPRGLFTSTADLAHYDLTVEQVLKGEATPRLAVLSAQSGASCGLEGVQEGARYVVFADREPSGALTASLCGGTQPASEQLVLETTEAVGADGRGSAAYGSILTLTYDEPAGGGLAGWVRAARRGSAGAARRGALAPPRTLVTRSSWACPFRYRPIR